MIANEALVGTLKGAPLSVLCCFMVAGPRAALKVTFLAQKTRYSRPAVYEALAFLHDLGYVECLGDRMGWICTLQLQQQVLDLAVGFLGEEVVNSVYNDVKSLYNGGDLSSGSSVSTQKMLTPPTKPTTSGANVNSVDNEVEGALISFGVFADVARELAGDPWVTVARVEAWEERLRGDSSVRSVAAVLCANLRARREAPAEQEAERQGRRRFVEGRYSEFVEH